MSDAPTPKAIFFDMDGTILDWQSGMEESWLAACEAHGDARVTPPRMHDAIRTRRTWFWADAKRAETGRLDLEEASREIVRQAFADLNLDGRDLAHRIADDYRARRTDEIVPYDGAIDVLKEFRARGTALALITNGGAVSQRQSIERFQLAQYFDCIVVEGEFGCGKPDPRVYHHALDALAANPETTWMVGDSLEADIAPACELGLHAVWVDGVGEGLPAGATARPHRIVRAITELL